jgi:hypothetical protein
MSSFERIGFLELLQADEASGDLPEVSLFRIDVWTAFGVLRGPRRTRCGAFLGSAIAQRHTAGHRPPSSMPVYPATMPPRAQGRMYEAAGISECPQWCGSATARTGGA